MYDTGCKKTLNIVPLISPFDYCPNGYPSLIIVPLIIVPMIIVPLIIAPLIIVPMIVPLIIVPMIIVPLIVPILVQVISLYITIPALSDQSKVAPHNAKKAVVICNADSQVSCCNST